MMRALGVVGLPLVLSILGSGCFDVGGEPAGPPTGDSGAATDSMAPPDTSTPRDAGDSSVPRDTGGEADTGGADTGGGVDTGLPDTGGSSCPDVFGAFSITAMGSGCGDLDASTTQRVDGDQMTCTATFSASGGIVGTGSIDGAGTLSGASLSLGTAPPTSCSGTWTGVTSSWMLRCGAAGPTRCNIQLVRTGP